MMRSSSQSSASATADPAQGSDAAETTAAVVALLLEQHGSNFAGYRKNMLLRRLALHAGASGDQSIAQYLERLRSDPEEAGRLIARLTIKVSCFFRDPTVFDSLQRLLKERLSEGGLRAWSAGCALGEEPYSLAMLALEHQAADRPSSVVASDLDAAALQRAEAGCYATSALGGLSDGRLATWFEPVGEGRRLSYRIRPPLRQSVRFVQHDLNAVTAPEGGPFDLVMCRNVLIYWSRPTQARMQELLCNSLAPGGLLCLGRSEWLTPALARRFDVADAHNRIFRLRPPVALGDR